MPKARSIKKTNESKSTSDPWPVSKNLLLWIREEPFLFGVLPHSHKNIQLSVLRQAILYMKEKGMYPYITFSQWVHTSTAKMQMSRELSACYFYLFYTITRDYNAQRQMVKTKQTNIPARRGNYHSVPTFLEDKEEINTTMFLLFLYIQNWTRPVKRLNNPKRDESWPKSTESELKIKPGTAKKSNWEIKCVNFLIDHLIDILNFLNEGEKKTDRVRFDLILSLDLILSSADFGCQIEYLSLDKILADGKTIEEIGYIKLDNSVDKIKFVKWVLTRLQINPWNSGSTVFIKKDIDVSTGNCHSFSQDQSNRVWDNNQNPPRLWCTISTVNDQVLYYNQFKYNSSLKIHRCSGSKLYIPGVFRYVTVEKCHNIEIFLGPVARVLRFIDCENITFHGISRNFVLREVRSSQFYLMSPNQPILCGGKNKNIVLAPYNTFYPKLEKHMAKIDMSCSLENLFNVPLDIAYDGQPVRNSQDYSYKSMKPEEFFPSVFPFKMKGETKANPFKLPPEYNKVLKLRKTQVSKFKEEVLNAKLPADQLSEFQQIVHVRFLSWLHLSERDGVLKGLESLEENESMKETNSTVQPTLLLSPNDNIQGKTVEAITILLKSLITGGSSLNPAAALEKVYEAKRIQMRNVEHTTQNLPQELPKARCQKQFRKNLILHSNFRSRLNAEIEFGRSTSTPDYNLPSSDDNSQDSDCFDVDDEVYTVH